MVDNIKSVPFDPGYSPISFSFMANIADLTRDYVNLKTMHQRKFKLLQLEPKIVEMIEKSSAFYLGCLLWGGYLASRFQDEPKMIEGNYTLKLSDEEKSQVDCTQETRFTLDYIKQFERDCKYYLNNSPKIAPKIIEILTSYNEFAELNKHFVNVEKTSDIKLPKIVEHLKELGSAELDKLREKIMCVIASDKIEGLYEIDFL